MAWSDTVDIGLEAGQTDYITRLNTLMDRSEAVNDEVVAARDGQANLGLSLDLRIAKSGLDANLLGATFLAKNFGDAADPQDLTTLAQVNALIAGGGSPGDIPITSLNEGLGTAYQIIRIQPDGTGVEGYWPGYITKTALYTASAFERIHGDTSGGAFTVNLPATPSTGAWVDFMPGNAAWETNNLTVGRNGATIEGLAENLVCDISKPFRLVYHAGNNDWRFGA